MRRFLLHVLPSGLVRIRQFGFLANRFRTRNLQLCRDLLAVCQTPAPADSHNPADTKIPKDQGMEAPTSTMRHVAEWQEVINKGTAVLTQGRLIVHATALTSGGPCALSTDRIPSGTEGRRADARVASQDPGGDTRKPKDGSTHWSCRKLAAAVGVSKDMVRRVWREAGVKPHRLERYLASDDPDFERKTADIIGLYMNPPQHAGTALRGLQNAVQIDTRQVRWCSQFWRVEMTS